MELDFGAYPTIVWGESHYWGGVSLSVFCYQK